MGKEYVALRPLDIGSSEIDEDRSTDEHQVAVVHHYQKGEVVKGAEGFTNLDALIANDYLAEKTKENSKVDDDTQDAVDALGPAATEVERSAARAEAAGAKPPKEIEATPAAESPATEKPPAKAKTTRKSTRKSAARKSTRRSPRT